MRQFTIPVLVFHHVSPDIRYYTNLPPPIFATMIACLAEQFEFWSVREAYQAFLAGSSTASRLVVTFDDGYEDNLVYARPILAEFGVRATFFALPRFAGGYNNWNRSCGYKTRHMDWDELARLQEDGHEIGSHGLSHRPLARLDASEAEEEMAESQQLLARRLGSPVRSFAYPYGRATPELASIAARYYDVSFSTIKSAYTDWVESPHLLRRVHLPLHATPEAVLQTVSDYRTT